METNIYNIRGSIDIDIGPNPYQWQCRVSKKELQLELGFQFTSSLILVTQSLFFVCCSAFCCTFFFDDASKVTVQLMARLLLMFLYPSSQMSHVFPSDPSRRKETPFSQSHWWGVDCDLIMNSGTYKKDWERRRRRREKKGPEKQIKNTKKVKEKEIKTDKRTWVWKWGRCQMHSKG